MRWEIWKDIVRSHWIRESIVHLVSAVLAAFAALPALAQTNTSGFSFVERGGVSMTTSGASSSLSVGYARITGAGADAAGFAIFGLRQNNILVSEATVPAAGLVNEGRIFAEIGGGVDTGIAIVNANNEPVELAFYFTDSVGRVFGAGVLTLPPRGQISRFLSQAPFNGSAVIGTFTFFTLRSDTDVRVGAIALRGFTNERGEFLMTTLPIVPIGSPELFGGSVLPQFVAGGGWTTEVVLVNPAEKEMAGTITFTDQAGELAGINSGNASGASFDYRVAAKSAWRLRTADTGALQLGSVRINAAAGADTPVGFLIFSFQSGSVTVSAAGVPAARPASATRLFIEGAGPSTALEPGWLQTGLAISNANSTVPVRVSFDLTTLNGESTGFRGDLDIPAGGQVARFVNELPGFAALPVPFQGVLRVSAPSTSIVVIGLRGRYNERGEVLLTTIPAINENDDYFNSLLKYSNFIFPHFADGAGYSTQFVLFSGWTPGSVTGTLDFFAQSGDPLSVSLAP
jgi:hypothetical protein